MFSCPPLHLLLFFVPGSTSAQRRLLTAASAARRACAAAPCVPGAARPLQCAQRCAPGQGGGDRATSRPQMRRHRRRRCCCRHTDCGGVYVCLDCADRLRPAALAPRSRPRTGLDVSQARGGGGRVGGRGPGRNQSSVWQPAGGLCRARRCGRLAGALRCAWLGSEALGHVSQHGVEDARHHALQHPAQAPVRLELAAPRHPRAGLVLRCGWVGGWERAWGVGQVRRACVCACVCACVRGVRHRGTRVQ